MDVHEIRRRHEDELLAIPNVTGVSTGKGDADEDVIVVYVTHMVSSGIPAELDGVPVKVMEIGTPTAQ
ncbi:hypothetical protein OHA25_53860 [Nonomuraea sp. NBC_00507]|jgi:hypothetical protein|uniref:hypothetical protein n=1 Tax=unclassified Nonomuraea TaxID=2593643 RepID=UPI00273C2BEF|nr:MULTISPECIES: hypothetical protein [unclassified Nonomuraea]MDP4509470.1 hypothetical protein [Nonomuraea sp. G32]